MCIKTKAFKSFRIRTYTKTGGGGYFTFPFPKSRFSFQFSLRTSRKFSPFRRSTSSRAASSPSQPRLWRLLMDRSVLSALFGSFIGISALGLLGFVSANPSPAPDPPKGDGNWRLLNPITYENISVFPVVAGSTYDTGHFLTLEEGLASGEVIVSEQGSVGIVRNRGDRVKIGRAHV